METKTELSKEFAKEAESNAAIDIAEQFKAGAAITPE